MKVKIILAIILIFFFAIIASATIFKKKEIPAPVVQQPQPAVVTKDCPTLAEEFIVAHGYRESGLLFQPTINFNPRMNSCLILVQLETKFKKGKLDVQYMYDFFDVTNNTQIATYRGIGHDPDEEPHTTECKIFGTVEYKCKKLKEFLSLADKILYDR